MKKKFLLTLSVVPLVLSGCTIKNENAIRKINYLMNATYDDEKSLIELTPSELISFVNTGAEISVLLYSTTCSSCTEAKRIVSSYARSKATVIFSVEMTTSSLATLEQAFPDYFSEEMTVPQIYVFNNKKLTYTYDQNNLLLEKPFKGEANKMFKASNVYFGREEKTVDRFVEQKKDMLIVTYNSHDTKSMKFVLDNVLFQAFDSKYITLLVDEYYVIDGFLNIPVKNLDGEIVFYDNAVNEVIEAKNRLIKSFADFSTHEADAKQIVNSFYSH